jgi:hypothetical protein
VKASNVNGIEGTITMQAAVSHLGGAAREDAPSPARSPRISAADVLDTTEMVLDGSGYGPTLENLDTGPSVPVIDRDGALPAAGEQPPRARDSFQGVAW